MSWSHELVYLEIYRDLFIPAPRVTLSRPRHPDPREVVKPGPEARASRGLQAPPGEAEERENQTRKVSGEICRDFFKFPYFAL